MRYLKMALWSALWAVPLTVVGLALCLTLVGIPLGIAVIVLGCKPIANLAMEQVRADVAKEARMRTHGDGTALDEGLDHPWLD